MTRELPTDEDLAVDEPGLNPAGAARRRLIRSLGLAAVASQVAIDWHKPRIHLGGLPAHAEATDRLCSFNLSMSFSATSTNPITLGVVGETLLEGITVDYIFSTVLTDSSFTTETTTVLPTGTNDIRLSWFRSDTNDILDYEMSASCCDPTADSSGGIETSDPLNGGELVFTVVVGDGTCSFDPT